VCPHQTLETHHAVAAVPSAGRLYVSSHVLMVWLGGIWGGSARQWPLSALPVTRLEGRSLLLPDDTWVAVLSDPEACAAAVEAARLRHAATRVVGLPLETLQTREGREIPLVYAR
jgi:hypothetical protein